MKTLILPLFAVLSLLGLSGCVTQPAATTPTSATYTLGDRASYKLDEIVVSLPLTGAPEIYHNLHISLGVLINPVRDSFSSDYDIQALVRRLEPRINAAVSASLMDTGPQVLANNEKRTKAISAADKILSDALRNWKYAADYKVEVTVLNYYWTDSSVGRDAPAPSRW